MANINLSKRKHTHTNDFEFLTKYDIHENNKQSTFNKKNISIQDYAKNKKITQYNILKDEAILNIDLSIPLIYQTKNGNIIEFVKYLARGSYGEVFQIMFNDKLYAMKILNLGNFRFNELQILNLNSKFFIGLEYYEFLHESQKALIVMNLADSNLENYINNNNTIDAWERIGLLYQFLKSIKTSSDYGYINCDIKPENILVCNKNELFLTDFGLCTPKYIENSVNQSLFMTAPENVCGNEYGGNSDVIFYINTKPYNERKNIMDYFRQKKSSKQSEIWAIGMTMLFIFNGNYFMNQNSIYENMVNLVELYIKSGESIDYIEKSQYFDRYKTNVKVINDIYLIIKKCLNINATKRPLLPEIIDEMDEALKGNLGFIAQNFSNGFFDKYNQSITPTFQEINFDKNIFENYKNLFSKCCIYLTDFMPEIEKDFDFMRIDRFMNVVVSMFIAFVQEFIKKLPKYSDILTNDVFFYRLILSCMVLASNEYNIDIYDTDSLIYLFNNFNSKRNINLDIKSVLTLNIFIFEILDTKVVFKNGGTSEHLNISFRTLLQIDKHGFLFLKEIEKHA